jgi:hypothetical protein
MTVSGVMLCLSLAGRAGRPEMKVYWQTDYMPLKVGRVALRLGLPAQRARWRVTSAQAHESFRRPCAALGGGVLAARELPPTAYGTRVRTEITHGEKLKIYSPGLLEPWAKHTRETFRLKHENCETNPNQAGRNGKFAGILRHFPLFNGTERTQTKPRRRSLTLSLAEDMV